MDEDLVLSTLDHERIACRCYQGGHDRVLVIAHGFYNSKDALLLQDLKNCLVDTYDVMMFDFRGHGKSSGLFTWTSREHFDLEAVLAYTKARYQKIGLIGISYGAAVGIEVLSGDRSVTGFVAVSAPYDCSRINFHFWNLDLENDIFYNLGKGRIGKGVRPGAFWLAKKKPIDQVGKIDCPVLYIHGEKDWVTSYRHSERLFEMTRAKKKIVLIKDGPHAEYLFRKNAQETLGLIKTWFAQTL
jgi:pimeloyl-ACP methyl ester carboxylesterase